MVNCIVKGCKREYYPGCGIRFHVMPTDDERRALWTASMKLNSNVSKSSRVCSLHFTHDNYMTESKTKLMPQAVPSILLPLATAPEKVEHSSQPYIVIDAQTSRAPSIYSNSSGGFHDKRLNHRKAADSCGSDSDTASMLVPEVLTASEESRQTYSVPKVTTVLNKSQDESISTHQQSGSDDSDYDSLIVSNKICLKTDINPNRVIVPLPTVVKSGFGSISKPVTNRLENEINKDTLCQKTNIHKFCVNDRVKSSAKEDKLRMEVKILRRKLKRRDAKIAKLKALLHAKKREKTVEKNDIIILYVS